MCWNNILIKSPFKASQTSVLISFVNSWFHPLYRFHASLSLTSPRFGQFPISVCLYVGSISWSKVVKSSQKNIKLASAYCRLIYFSSNDCFGDSFNCLNKTLCLQYNSQKNDLKRIHWWGNMLCLRTGWLVKVLQTFYTLWQSIIEITVIMRFLAFSL